jgi:putative ABC transport system permease protein
MFKNYIKIALRNLKRNITYSLINIASLGVSIAIVIVIFSWIKNELSYDRFYKNSDNIYRVIMSDEESATLSPAFKTHVFDQIPDVKYSTRILKADFLGQRTKIKADNQFFTNDEVYYADEDFFDIFSFPFILGSAEQFVQKPNAVVITEKTANKYFGNSNPMGKRLMIEDKKELEVAGVIKDVPDNSHLHFDLLIGMKNFPLDVNSIGFGSTWIFPSYIKIYGNQKPDVVVDKLNKKLAEIRKTEKNMPTKNLFLQPITDIHLYSHLKFELENNGDIKKLYLFFAIGLLIIIIACINYINLTTACFSERTKEVGVRKVIGAERIQLMNQFLTESVITSFISLLFAVILLLLVKPFSNLLFGAESSFSLSMDTNLFVIVFLSTIGLGILVGLFPAIILSKLQPLRIFKSGLNPFTKQGTLRKVLVVFQFSVAIILIVGAIVIFQQMKMIQNKNLGYKREQLIVLHVGYREIQNKLEIFGNLLKDHSEIVSTTEISQLPTDVTAQENIDTRIGRIDGAYFLSVDKDFFKTVSANVIEGKERIDQLASNKNTDISLFTNKFVVNQAFLKRMGVQPKDAASEEITIRHGNMKPGQIIGVVKDFNFQSLYNPIRPLVIEFTPWDHEYMLIKISSKDIPATIKLIESEWKSIANGVPFEFSFLDDIYNSLYRSETQSGKMIFLSTIVSIGIAALGLFGLISFTTRKRTKEIGIRKVIGASDINILVLLTKDFTKWIAISNIIAWPVAYYFTNRWLENYAYRIEINWWIFILSGGIALLIALLTVSYQAIKAATANPVKSLRYE